MEGVLKDLRYALRHMRKTPGFTAIVILTLSLAIGTNTALFTIVNAVLLKPLPVPNPNQLAFMVWDAPNRSIPVNGRYNGNASSDFSTTGHLQGTSFPYSTFERFRQLKDIFSDVFAFATNEKLNLIADGQAELVSGQFVTGDYYQGLGVRAFRGRMLNEADEASGAAPTAVITFKYWQQRFAGDSSVVGRAVTVNSLRFTIIGISPPQFSAAMQVDETADLTLPISTEPLVRAQNPRLGTPGVWWLRIMARLQPGLSREKAQARLDPVFQQSVLDESSATNAARIQKTKIEPRDYPHLFVTAGAQGDEFSRRQFRQPLTMLMVMVGIALLIACINVANLLLAQSSARHQEFAVRIALGAARSRLARQLLTECLLLSAIAGVTGSLLAIGGKQLLLNWAQWFQGRATLDAGLDLRVLGFTVGISVLAGGLFGLSPALRARRTKLASNTKVQIGSTGRSLFGRLLIASQIAISLVLLVAMGLFVRTLRNLNRVDPGFNGKNLLLFHVKPEARVYKNTGVVYDAILQRLSSIPGVQGAALSRHPLLGFTHIGRAVYLSANNQHNGEIVELNVISPSFFETMEIPVERGRPLLQSDTPASTPVVVVNQAFAREYFPGTNAIGQQFWLDGGGEGTGWPLRRHLTAPPNGRPVQIIGVSRDAKYTDLRMRLRPTVYQSYAQAPTDIANFEVRYRGDQSAAVTAVREAVRQVDVRLPIFDLRTQSELSRDSLAEERMFANLSAGIGALTLLLVAIGVYGVVSYSVGRRTTEIGVRIALGARHVAVLGMILRESFFVVFAGLLVGYPIALTSALVASQFLSGLLFEIKATDPLSFAIAISIILAVALIASYVPARRAVHVDPIAALRSE